MSNVFICHKKLDRVEAEQLAQDIKRAGHTVWFDEWQINIGDSIVERVNEGLTGTTYLILCYSSSGAATLWMNREWMSTLSRQLSGSSVKILPVRLTGGQPPAILNDIKYADLVTDWLKGVSDLLKSMGP